MQTMFTAAQLEDPATRVSEKVLRTCVHCGFCTATCPTYVLLGDELDSPRGRIYLMKQMLESGKPPTAEVVKHIDRCLSCLSCMTTCPSGVHYMHLVDHGRAYIEEHYRRPLADRLTRWVLQRTIPYPALFRLSLIGAAVARPFAGLMPERLRTMLSLAPRSLPSASPMDRPQSFGPQGQRRARMALLTGCAQQVLAPQINEATVRLLTRLGVEVVVPKGMGCCGALTHHMGREHAALAFAKANIDAWTRELEPGRAGRGGDQRLGLRHHGQGLWLHAARGSGLRREGGPDLGADQGHHRDPGRPGPAAGDDRHRPGRRLPFRLLDAARPEDHAACPSSCSPRPGSRSRTCPRVICAAARPAPTISCSPRSPGGCATARSPTSRAPGRR